MEPGAVRNHLRELLAERRMTHAALGLCIGRHRAQISRMVNEENPNHSIRLALQIAAALDVKVDALYSLPGDRKRRKKMGRRRGSR